jgi:ketosteroid isomerase-like protein
MTTRNEAADWLQRYIDAWARTDIDAIGRLFSADAAYYYSPFKEPHRGREQIVAFWLEEPDAPGTFEAHYAPLAVDGDLVVADGWTRYFDAPGGNVTLEFSNIFTMRFNQAGECTEFREWYVQKR